MKTIHCGAALLQEQRADARAGAFMRAMERYDDRTRAIRGCGPGRSETGMHLGTRRLGMLNVFVDKWYVNLPMKREDHAKLPGSLRDAENRIRAGVPRKALNMHLHIIPAVRLLKHIRHGYTAELEATERLLAPLDALNLKLAKKGQRTGSEISSAIRCLDDFRDSQLARKHSAVKRIAAKGRLEETLQLLQNTLGLDGNARAMEVSRACAQFSAFRARLGEWRDRDVAGIAVHNLKRECALRIERDRWVLAQLDRFATSLEKIYEYDLVDHHKRDALIELEALISRNAPKELVLMQLRAASRLFRVPERARMDVAEAGLLAAGRKVDYLIAHYGWLYRYAGNGQKEKALAKLDFISTFVNGNKPPFILRELSRDADAYLAPVLEKLEKAVGAYRLIYHAADVSAAFAAAKAAFAAARDELKKIVAPDKS
ncbi:MAG: hypothetical protein PHV13_00950 [Candidatus ainarchaeum sp.]|nr:hypothetical protein [Candidatus ainarchaeum sp.]